MRTPQPKQVKLPGPDHPITITPSTKHVMITVAGTVIADTTRSLLLEESGYGPVYYIPREDANMSLLERTKHYSYCPYKGDCTYFSIPLGGDKSEYAVWSYEEPYPAMASIKDLLAFYPSRVDSLEVTDSNVD